MKLKNLISAPFILFGITVVFIFYLKVTNVECHIKDGQCPESLKQNLEKLKNSSFFFIDIQKELISEKIETETYSFQSSEKKFPGTLRLNFIEESVLYEVKHKDQTYYVGKLGSILSTNQNNDDLIKVTWVPNNNFTTSHQELAKLANISKKFDLKIDEVIWNNFDNIHIFISGQPKIIIDEEGINSKIESIDIIVNSREISEFEGAISEIDLRFNLPVLRTRP